VLARDSQDQLLLLGANQGHMPLVPCQATDSASDDMYAVLCNVNEAQMPKFEKKYWFKVRNKNWLKKYCQYYYQSNTS